MQRGVHGAGKGHGRNAVHDRLEGRAQRAGIGDVEARVIAVVDAGENIVRPFHQQILHRDLHAVRGRAVHHVSRLHGNGEIRCLIHPHIPADRYFLGHGAALMGRRHHRDLPQLHSGLSQQRDTGSVDGVVVHNQNLHMYVSSLCNFV